MRESLGSRVGRLIAGGIHSIVDAVENAAPEVAMEQALREIDGAIDEIRTDLGQVEAQRHLTGKRLAEESGRHERLTEQARLALGQGRDDLAVAAVERQVDIEAQLPVLEARLSELAEDKLRLEGYVTALQAKKREMRDALGDYLRSRQAPAASAGGAALRGDAVQARVERAKEAFDRVFLRQTGLPTGGGGDAAKLAELEELARQHRVAERLAKIKAGDA